MSSMLLSIIVPCYNVEEYLVECVESFKGGLNDRCECILIDDASTDGTADVLQGYECECSFRVFYNAENIGLGMSRNKGIGEAKGEYILFLDSDDWLMPGALNTILLNLDKGCELILFDYMRVFSGFLGSVRSPHGLSLSKINSENTIFGKRALAISLPPMACFRVYSKAYIEKCSAEFGSGYYEDVFWSVKLLSLVSSIYVIEEVLYAYRMRPGSILRSKSDRHLCILLEYQKSLDFCSGLGCDELFNIVIVNAVEHYIFLLFEKKSRMSLADRVSLMKLASAQIDFYAGIEGKYWQCFSDLKKMLLMVIRKQKVSLYLTASFFYSVFFIPFRSSRSLLNFLSRRAKSC